jgi:hypothetical protein
MHELWRYTGRLTSADIQREFDENSIACISAVSQFFDGDYIVIYKSTDNATWCFLWMGRWDAGSYVDNNVVAGVTYYYRAYRIRRGVISSASNDTVTGATTYSFTKSLAYAVKSTPAALTKALGYAVKSTPAAMTKALAYRIKITPAAMTKALAYKIKSSPVLQKSLGYLIKTTPAALTKALAYKIKATPAPMQKTLAYSIKSSQSFTKSLQYKIGIPTAMQKGLAYSIKSSPILQKALAYSLKSTQSFTKALAYEISTSGPKVFQKSLAYAIKSTQSFTKSLAYKIGVPTVMQKGLAYAVKRTPAALTKSLAYLIKKSYSFTKTLAYSIKSPQVLQKSLTYTIKSSSSFTKSLTYKIGVPQSPLQKPLEYKIGVPTSFTKALTYEILALIEDIPTAYVTCSLNNTVTIDCTSDNVIAIDCPVDDLATINLLSQNQADCCENGTTNGFSGYAGATITAEDTEYYQGSHCLKTVTPNVTSGEGWITSSSDPYHIHQTAKKITASGWFKGSGTIRLYIYAYGAICCPGALELNYVNITLTSVWTKYSVTFNFTNASIAHYLLAGRTTSKQSATIYTDALQFELGDFATPWTSPNATPASLTECDLNPSVTVECETTDKVVNVNCPLTNG